MEIDNEIAPLFARLWDGYENRHIETNIGNERNKKGKLDAAIKTVNGPVTDNMICTHISGGTSIGVAPQRADSMVSWGVLDVDWYDMPQDAVEQLSRRIKAKCAAFRSKSGGLHIYFFTTESVTARVMHDYLVSVRKRLPKDVQKKTELFPNASQTIISADAQPTAVNLPVHGQARPLAFLIDNEQIQLAHDETLLLLILTHIDTKCRADAETLTQIANATPIMDGSDLGYKVPNNPAGRNELLMRIAMSMQARGWPDSEMDAEINRLNREGGKSDNDVISSIMDEPLPHQEIGNLLKSAKKREKGTPQLTHYRMIERFNRRWSKITIHGQVEYVDKNAREFTTFKKEAMFDETSDQTVKIGKATIPLAKVWLRDIDHARFKEVVCEPLNYDGPGYNVWKGFKVIPVSGDVSLFEDYILNVLCSGDAKLAHWLTMWLADAVQCPTEPSPPTAVAMRGPQGSGKSFLQEQILTRIFGERYVYKVQQASRMFAQFNRSMFGATFVAAEESIFHGSQQMAATLKDFISSPSWTYEEKFKAAFPQKNVHRLIATTNNEQAVHIDFDDRRWTIIDVKQRFDTTTIEGQAEARAFWEPYHTFIKSEDGAGKVLRHLLDYAVDRNALLFGYGTDAKRQDKVQSNPVLAVLDDIAAKGFCPDDLQALGVVSSPSFTKAVKDQGGLNMSPKMVMARLDKLIPSCETVTNARTLRGIARSLQDDFLTVQADMEGGQRGRQLPPLPEFRATVAHLTGEDYEDGKERWHAWSVQRDVPDPNENLPF